MIRWTISEDDTEKIIIGKGAVFAVSEETNGKNNRAGADMK